MLLNIVTILWQLAGNYSFVDDIHVVLMQRMESLLSVGHVQVTYRKTESSDVDMERSCSAHTTNCTPADTGEACEISAKVTRDSSPYI